MAPFLYQVLRDNDLKLREANMPKSVKIGIFKYDVLFPYNFDFMAEPPAAQAHHEGLEFQISDAKCKEVRNQNLMYMIVCAVSNFLLDASKLGSGDDETKHLRVCFAHGFHQVVMDNKLDILFREYGKTRK